MNFSKSNEIVKRDQKVIANASRIKFYPFVMAKGYGAIVEDVDGNQYIDLLSSAAALNLGHSHPKVVEAVKKAADDFTHYGPVYFYQDSNVSLAEKLVAATPGDFAKKVSFGLTGSDSNDGAIKFARGYTKRDKIIAFKGAYHGSTFGAISLSHISLNMRRKIGSLLPDIFAFDFPNVYRNGIADGQRCLQQIEEAFKSYLPPEEVAAIIVEPIQGDAGLLVPPKDFIQGLAKICQKHGILFVSEEVQQCYMRTGKMFAIEHFEVVPDMVIIAKPMAGGLPMSAIIGRQEIMDCLDSPAHAFTFAANNIACSAAIATIDVVNTPEFQNDVLQKGALLKQLLDELKEKYKFVGDVRGLGLSIGVEIVKDKESKEADPLAAIKIIYKSWQRGVILVTLAGNVLRIQPPLVISEAEIKQAVKIIDLAMQDYAAGKISDEEVADISGW